MQASILKREQSVGRVPDPVVVGDDDARYGGNYSHRIIVRAERVP